MIEDEDLLHAAEYALAIVRRTAERATAEGLDAEYQAALTTLTAYVEALQTASMSSRETPIVLQIVGPVTRTTVGSEPVDPKAEAITDALHWIWAWEVQVARLVESTNAQGLGATAAERRRSFSRATLDEHILIVVGGNLDRALQVISPFLPDLELDEDHRKALRLLRNLYEHWDEQRATFKPGVAKVRSGKEFAEKFPQGRPWSIVYEGHDWMLGGLVPMHALSKVLSALELHILSHETGQVNPGEPSA